MKRYGIYVNNHGAWHGRQTVEEFEAYDGRYIKVSDLIEYFNSIDCSGCGSLEEIKQITRTKIADAVLELLKELEK